jgi:hypothetical protein
VRRFVILAPPGEPLARLALSMPRASREHRGVTAEATEEAASLLAPVLLANSSSSSLAAQIAWASSASRRAALADALRCWEPFARPPPLVPLVTAFAHDELISSLRAAAARIAPVGLAPHVVPSLELSSTKKKRAKKMNRHKVKKRRKKDRFKNKA